MWDSVSKLANRDECECSYGIIIPHTACDHCVKGSLLELTDLGLRKHAMGYNVRSA